MFHMQSAFGLRPGVSVAEIAAAWDALILGLSRHGLIVAASGLAERRADTPLDTNDESAHRYFTVMTFRDRAQSEAAWDAIAPWEEPLASRHIAVFSRVENAVFTCWEDVTETVLLDTPAAQREVAERACPKHVSAWPLLCRA